jgi:hypothetical protein
MQITRRAVLLAVPGILAVISEGEATSPFDKNLWRELP